MTEQTIRFGKLEKVPATSSGGFRSEATDFTPWLAANIDVLGQELGLSLQVRQREYQVGRYYLDILAEDAKGRVVIIENQFGQTNHDHLGKLLTYCAGTNAALVVWVAESLTEEHIAALEWLNENTIEGTGFFGVELELLRVDDSRLAPHFRVVVQPNEWAKRSRPAGSTVEWDWQAYTDSLRVSPDRIAITRKVVEGIADEVARQGLDWTTRFNKGYVTFRRRGGYVVLGVDFYWTRPVRIYLKLPAAPEELRLTNPFPDLPDVWIPSYQEWGWAESSLDRLPDLAVLVDLAHRYLTGVSDPAESAP